MKYYVLVSYSELFSSTTEGSIAEVEKPLETVEGLTEFMEFLREEHKDAIVRWWTPLQDQQGELNAQAKN